MRPVKRHTNQPRNATIDRDPVGHDRLDGVDQSGDRDRRGLEEQPDRHVHRLALRLLAEHRRSDDQVGRRNGRRVHHFQALTSTLTFAPGTTSQTATATILGPKTGSVNKAFTVVLASPTGGATLGTATSTVTIAGTIAGTSAQVAAGVAAAGDAGASLTVGQLQPIVARAERDWESAGITSGAKLGPLFFRAGARAPVKASTAGGRTISASPTAFGRLGQVPCDRIGQRAVRAACAGNARPPAAVLPGCEPARLTLTRIEHIAAVALRTG
jgi:hypothetical protein